MAKIKVSNEEVIQKAKNMIRIIQCDRNKAEIKAIENVCAEFENYNAKWIFKRDLKMLFKLLGPGIIFGIFIYPFSVLSRIKDVVKKPREATPFKKAEWVGTMEDYLYSYADIELESSLYEKQLKSCQTLKCMAENNEEDFIWITNEEAKDLRIY